MVAVRRALWLFVLLGGLGCKRQTSTPTPAASVSVAASAVSAPAPAVARVAPKGAPAFLRVAPLPSGPIVVKGYPHDVANGMNEYADRVGFSADSALFVYAWETGGLGGTVIEILARDGSKRTMRNDRSGDDPPDPKWDARQRDLEKFLDDEKIASITPPRGPALVGTWKYTDITLDVVRIEASGGTPSTGPTHPAHVQVGGAVGSEKPVHPISLAANRVPQAPPHWATLNAFVMSPDGEELGLLENTFACEYCIDFAVRRVGVGELASLVYNDTGYRHHRKKEWAEAAALFEKAVAADPTAKLAAYNLACAWARTGDPRTKEALAYAMSLDASVKERAQKDEDFAAVRGEPWFPKP